MFSSMFKNKYFDMSFAVLFGTCVFASTIKAQCFKNSFHKNLVRLKKNTVLSLV